MSFRGVSVDFMLISLLFCAYASLAKWKEHRDDKHPNDRYISVSLYARKGREKRGERGGRE